MKPGSCSGPHLGINFAILDSKSGEEQKGQPAEVNRLFSYVIPPELIKHNPGSTLHFKALAIYGKDSVRRSRKIQANIFATISWLLFYWRQLPQRRGWILFHYW